MTPRMFIPLAICLALFGLVLFRMVSNSAAGGLRVALKLIGFVIMIGGVVLACLIWTGKIA